MKFSHIPLSLYIHFPWCIQKCPYCDFNSHAVRTKIDESAYINALLSDLDNDLQYFNIARPISSIFMGGGTPSLFSPESIEQLLSGIYSLTSVLQNAEITLEANPGTFESNKFSEFRTTGINRLSIGIQSFNNQHLKLLGRVHSAREAIRAAEIASQSGFENFNMDFMFGLPEGSETSTIEDINTAISLNPTHISFYQLTLEPHTHFYKFPPKLPHVDEIYNTQKSCQKILQDNGYKQYEVSAYSKTNYQCKHNLNYWQFGDYLGIGAGAHGKITGSLPENIIRYSKFRSPGQYLEKVNKQQQLHTIKQQDLPLEYMLNQLRLKKGFDCNAFPERTGLSLATLQPVLARCVKQGLLVYEHNRYYCSAKGWNFLDDVVEQFMDE